ncbi:uncharacterized protein B0H18DRAFT_977762 [Fomitopsis serialis]|uniref:uncharacterized protein n=1 Tax=Fomitopsis serialis TaxID=139415 RepID=UPI0020089A01|nr:uncharacterized protein B0H18DRAFT_977762 [Neoantrodia serialis]KAH9934694.1 hypothetical protein B0H18DRAFT_977762 [Neoantrodia serialis]
MCSAMLSSETVRGQPVTAGRPKCAVDERCGQGVSFLCEKNRLPAGGSGRIAHGVHDKSQREREMVSRA